MHRTRNGRPPAGGLPDEPRIASAPAGTGCGYDDPVTSSPVLLSPPEHRWECPRCDLTEVTRESRAHTRFHPCRGMAGLTAPMVPAGTCCKMEARLREDYLGGEAVTVDGEGRPVMAVEVTRDDGTDVAVFAPMARVEAE